MIRFVDSVLLFFPNIGLVSANVFDKDKLTSLCNKATGAGGEAVNALGDYVKSLTTQGKEALNKHFQVQIYISQTATMQ